MKKMWCDLCGKQITDLTFTKVETSIRDCNSENIVYEYDYNYYPVGPLEVHQECLFKAFSDFQKKQKLPEGKE